MNYRRKSIRQSYRYALPFTARAPHHSQDSVCARYGDFFLIIFLCADRLWRPNALARRFEFHAGFLVLSRAWGSYPFSPFHRSTDYFLSTIGRVRMKGIYDRDFLIDDESAAIEVCLIPNSTPSNPIHYWKTTLKNVLIGQRKAP